MSDIRPVHCGHCGVPCKACGVGEVHMNTDPLPEGVITSNLRAVQRHNDQGRMHVMFNGASNELVLCGSPRSDELAVLKTQWSKKR